MGNRTWPDDYLQKRTSPKDAIRRIQSGQRVFIGTACGEPQRLVKELAAQSGRLADLEIMQLYSQEVSPLTLIADQSESNCFTLRSFYLGSAKPRILAKDKRFLSPINLSALPGLFKSRQLPIHAALIQVSPPDDFGWMSLGISVDVTMAAAQAADLVIAQVNPRMPRVMGRSFIHVNEVDVFVEYEEELLTVKGLPEMDSAFQIGRHVAKLIDDGSTLQLGLGIIPQATLESLVEKKDLGIHTPVLTDEILPLVAMGVITNRKKGFNEGKLVASGAIGSRNLYEFLDDNPSIEFFPSDYVNNPVNISRHHKMVSLNVAMTIDLTGQVGADALPYTHYSGVSDMMDFIRGAAHSEGGKSILMIPSTTMDGKSSRIVSTLERIAVVVPRGDVQFVVTEFGVANLFGKNLQERAIALISIAHPDFREGLFCEAKESGILGTERNLSRSICGIYPHEMEEMADIQGQPVFFRPAKPVDERLIQEHFYNMDREDVAARFLQEKLIFSRKDLSDMIQVDYVNEMAMVAVIGELGFEKVIGVGGYFLILAQNIVEAAFSVLKPWQKKGIGTVLLKKLAKAAQDQGVVGFFVYTQPQNQGMIRLFRKLPNPVTTTYEEDMLLLSCRFDESI
ncbi:MAG: acetyl-CoA hydrolase [Deltaproteobacteria bacterium RBG_13_43_22]|nr:MAG: acetyl-CoA hydrolase [Deltaproteobacteria bacterium RBG_13_43_22]